MAIDYSDGQAIEREILEILDGADDLGSSRSIASERYSRWPLRYHLCAERANLLRHLGFEGLDVLELGAGMGAVSRFLAERAGSLTVVEGAEARFRGLQARLRDLDNWSGIVANITDARLEHTFDVVCVIGVLEYAELYVPAEPGESPFVKLLETATHHLSPPGVLILAIENKLGLKYWSGAPEDHLNALFAGVCDYPRAPTPRTFSRRELVRLLRQVGFSKVDEFYPFPDYKVPNSVISADFARLDPELAASVATAGALDNRSGPRMRLFPEQLAAKSLARAGLLPELANSFLLVASRTGESDVRRRVLARPLAGEVGWHYSTARRIPTVTIFLATADGRPDVEKHRLDGGLDAEEFSSPRSGAVVRWRAIPRRRVVSGTLLRDRLLQDAYFERWQEFRVELLRFLRWVIQNFSVAGEPGRLHGTNLDAIYTNATIGTDDTFRLFDLEWELGAPLPVTWFVLRNVAPLGNDAEALSTGSGFASLAELYEHLCRALDVVPALDDDLSREADLRALVLSRSDYQAHLEGLTHGFHRPFAARGFPRVADAEVIPRPVSGEREEALRRAEAEIESGRMRRQEMERALVAYQERDALITYRLATKAHAFVRQRPWAHRVAKFVVTSALRLRARLARRRPA